MTSVEVEIRGKKITLETGLMAKQSDGAVVARCGDTIVLATAVAAKTPREGLDFFPLTIDYLEKAYSAARFPVASSSVKASPQKKSAYLPFD